MVSGAAGFLLFPMVGLRGFIQQWRDSALDVTPKEGISMKDDASDFTPNEEQGRTTA